MAKIYDKKKKEIMWEDDGLLCLLEEALWDIKEVLELRNPAKIDGYDEWLIKVYCQMDGLLDLLIEKENSLNYLLDRELLAEKE